MDYDVNTLFNQSLMLFDQNYTDSADFLTQAADFLYKKGYVRASYKEAIIKREELYPTGLPTDGVSVAIPHTDIEHAIKPCILVAKPANRVPFKQMADGINDVYVQLIFLVVVTDPKKEVQILKKLMDCFLCKEKLQELASVNTPEIMIDAISRLLN